MSTPYWRMKAGDSPCFNGGAGCPGREPGCHASCAKYLSWKRGCDDSRERRREAKLKNDAVNGAINENKEKWHRRHDYQKRLRKKELGR